MSCIILFRDIGGVPIDVVIKESAEAAMEIPSHPVETGARISDHAWRTPTALSLECASAGVSATYEALFAVMKQAEPFAIVTGFTLFDNMLISRAVAGTRRQDGQCLEIHLRADRSDPRELAGHDDAGTGRRARRRPRAGRA